MSERPIRWAFLVAVIALSGGCQRSQPSWSRVPPTPRAKPYEGAVKSVLDIRLEGRVRERHQRVISSRVEHLATGVDWPVHIAWRAQHADDLAAVRDMVPESDAPVLMAEFGRAARTLYVIGRADVATRRIVVLTALVAQM